MPIYVFQCADCGEEFEKIVDMGSTDAKCKTCGQESYRVYDKSCQFAAHNLPNGHIGARARK
jgi:putative FmdB family regulatory protein